MILCSCSISTPLQTTISSTLPCHMQPIPANSSKGHVIISALMSTSASCKLKSVFLMHAVLQGPSQLEPLALLHPI